MVGCGTVLHEACGKTVPVAPGFCLICGLTFSDAVMARDVVKRLDTYPQMSFVFDIDEEMAEGRMAEECLVY